jgi:hypothetical protein
VLNNLQKTKNNAFRNSNLVKVPNNSIIFASPHNISMQYKIFIIIITSFIFSQSLFAQKNKKNPTDIRKIDTLLQPIPNNRQLFHIKIDDELQRVDYLDGKYDDKVANYRGEKTDVVINNDILRRAKALANFVENETFAEDAPLNNNTKIRYLRVIETDLKEFSEDMYDGQANVEYYKDMFDGLEDMMVANKQGKLKEYVKMHANMSVYLNRSLIENDKELMNILMDSMCYKYPDMMEGKLASIAQYDGACAVMAYMAKKSINRVMSSATSTNYERDIVRRCNDPLVKAINAIATKTKKEEQFNALLFIGEYMAGRKTIEEIQDLVSTPEKYYKSLVKLRLDNNESSAYVTDIKLRQEGLFFVREINRLHNENSPKIRYASLDNLSPKELYYLAVLCNEEIYTSSFVKGVYPRLVERMKPNTGDEFLQTVNMDKFRTFVRMCANYNLLDSFLYTMSEPSRNTLMTSFVEGLGDRQEINMEGAVDVADAFGSINDPKLIGFLQDKVRSEYEKNYSANNKDGLVVYFILYSLFTSKTEGNDDSTFNSVMTNKLKMPPINKMPFNRLVSENSGKVYEQVFFYGDEDGRASYGNFKNFITKSGLYKMDESNEWYTKVTAINSKVPFEIYANKPLDEEKELDEKAQLFLANYLVEQNIHPSIIVHRGHSYHLPTTISNISDDNKVVILGSCGGYHNLATILERSADAQMVSSKQVGAMAVNDPIIREVNDAVMNGRDVNWVDIWRKLELEMKTPTEKDLFNDYVPPHKNLGALFLKAFKSLKENQM